MRFVASNVSEELATVLRNNKQLLDISDQLSRLVRTVPFPAVTAKGVTKTFVTHWVMVYTPTTQAFAW